MGNGATIHIPVEHAQALSPQVFQILDHDLQHGALHIDRTDTSLSISDAELFERIQSVVTGATKEVDLPLAECRCPAVILFKYKALAAEQQEEFAQSVFDAAVSNDHASASKHKHEEFAQSFGGTEADHKAEAEAAQLLRGDQPSTETGVLAQPDMVHPSEHTVLRQAGRWAKFLSAAGCYVYVHSLTRDLVAVRPDEFVEDEVATSAGQGTAEVDQDPANGLPTVPLTELPAMVEHIVRDLHKTPLLIDTSPSEVVRTFYSYKANVADASSLTVPYGKSGVKKEEIMERCRHVLVASLKKGQPFVLFLGGTSIEHADLKGKLCKKDVFPKDVFVHAGLDLLGPDYDPKYKHLYRDEDLEAGQAIARDGFHAVVVTSLGAFEFEKRLEDCIPLGYMHPVFVLANK